MGTTANAETALSKTAKPSGEERYPWERQPGESIQAYRRFMEYRLMPPGERSLRKLDISYTLANRWAKRWHWTKRTCAYDDHVSECIDGLSNRAQLSQRYHAARLGSAFVRHTEGQLDKVKLTTVDDLVNLAKAGVAIERQALMLTEASGDTRADRAPVAQVAVSFGSAPPWLTGPRPAELSEGQPNEAKPSEVVVVAGEQVLARPPAGGRRTGLAERKVNCPRGNSK